MNLLNSLIALLVVAQPALAIEADQQKLACLFQKPFIFGASISAGYGGVGDATGAFAKLKASELIGTSSSFLGSNPDPATRLAMKYNANPDITNISELINQMKFSAVGYEQFENYISVPDQEANLRRSSVIVSIDGLYWPTIYGEADECGYAEYAMRGTQQVIQYAQYYGIPLMLGSVPEEDPSKVALLLRGNAVIPSSWWPPKTDCVRKVNAFLRRECKVENQCYILDMHGIVENLKGTQGPHDRPGISFEGKDYSYNQFREDGVHLYNTPPLFHRGSKIPDGMRYVMKYIEKSVGWNLPACKAVAEAQ